MAEIFGFTAYESDILKTLEFSTRTLRAVQKKSWIYQILLQKVQVWTLTYLRDFTSLRSVRLDHLPDLKAPVRCAYRYLSNRLDQIDYKNSIEQGLPIGSGLIESGHKHVIQAGMKIAGAAWSPPVADAMIQTRAHRASGLWQEFWKN
jgi:hypothetical protein